MGDAAMFAAMGMEPTELEPITLLLQWGSRERVPVSIRPDATVGELKEAYALSIGEVTAERCRLLWRGCVLSDDGEPLGNAMNGLEDGGVVLVCVVPGHLPIGGAMTAQREEWAAEAAAERDAAWVRALRRAERQACEAASRTAAAAAAATTTTTRTATGGGGQDGSGNDSGAGGSGGFFDVARAADILFERRDALRAAAAAAAALAKRQAGEQREVDEDEIRQLERSGRRQRRRMRKAGQRGRHRGRGRRGDVPRRGRGQPKEPSPRARTNNKEAKNKKNKKNKNKEPPPSMNPTKRK